MGKMKELYTTGQELPIFDPPTLDFEDAVRIIDWLNEALYAERPAEDLAE